MASTYCGALHKITKMKRVMFSVIIRPEIIKYQFHQCVLRVSSLRGAKTADYIQST